MFSTLKEQLNSLIALVRDDGDQEEIPENADVICEDILDATKEVTESPREKKNLPPIQAESLTNLPQETNQKTIQLADLPALAITRAKSLGSLLFSAASEVGSKLKKTVEENAFLREFNKEQDCFVKDQGKLRSSAVPPWIGSANEAGLREVCLSLSHDRRNFFRSPPDGVDFRFDYETSYPIAAAIMEYDANLEKMRYELVPKAITEENFWRNYFYRVSLICQADDGKGEDDRRCETEEDPPLEFVSDSIKASSEDVIRAQEDIKRLSLKSAEEEEEEWEKELEVELQDYAVDYNQDGESRSESIEDVVDEVLDG